MVNNRMQRDATDKNYYFWKKMSYIKGNNEHEEPIHLEETFLIRSEDVRFIH